MNLDRQDFISPISSAFSSISGGIRNIFGGSNNYEELIQQQLAAGAPVIASFQQEAAGIPSQATRNTMRQVRQNTTAAQQSYAASATARGTGGTPVAAQQARFRAAETRTLGNVLGAAQQNASNQLSSMYQTATAQQGALEEAERQYRIQFMYALANFISSAQGDSGEYQSPNNQIPQGGTNTQANTGYGGIGTSVVNDQGMDSQSAEMHNLIQQLVGPEELASFNAGADV